MIEIIYPNLYHGRLESIRTKYAGDSLAFSLIYKNGSIKQINRPFTWGYIDDNGDKIVYVGNIQ